VTKVTLKDIADKVGISQQTVSKVLNKRNFTVSATTKKKILTTARKLNYRPNVFAQVLKTGRTNMIGIATMGSSLGRFDMPYAARVYQGISDYYAKHNYKLIFRNLDELVNKDRGLSLAENRAVDGLIFLLFSHEVGPFKKKQAPVLNKLGIPYVVIHSLGQDFGFNSVGLDTVRGGGLAAEHLLEHGYHTAGGIGCVKTPVTNIHCTAMLKGFRQGLARHKVKINPKHVFEIPRVETRLGYQLAKGMVSRKAALPRALFVIDDVRLAKGLD
jgi:LacI family transcriptional regulator